ncbi:Asp23/Gls24 family envelope stress response protein [Sinosporangium siamense]|uniref:Asp23/Gls24 family envelope stress response protein n=1 Tax=Sinosporangium siamense TaxID=1367973 RepID=A0A919RFX4_9ACTN|nr:Asp23/Gls24 family envelope stress response protein [Sinosporangium siamense]GII92652.1 hypothetical protein Ssi02_28830 [Sinosporangium siamense]
MTDVSTGKATGEEASVPRARTKESALVTAKGTTTIDPSVVAKIAGLAAREVTGVHEMGAGAARAIGAVRGIVGGERSATQGVSVEVGERQAAIDIDLVVDYGVAIPDLANGVRKNVIAQIERMCGLEVTEVNIRVDDVHLPGQEKAEEEQQRPQARVE